MTARVFAADWTGAREPVRNLWLAEAEPGCLHDVREFDARQTLTTHLLAIASDTEEMFVGLDFAFSLPAWFLDEVGAATHEDLWRHMADHADEWLAPRDPFWGNAGRPPISEEFRRTERDVGSRIGKRPTSPFKLVGADQVGRGSLRGMLALAELLGEELCGPLEPCGDPVR